MIEIFIELSPFGNRRRTLCPLLGHWGTFDMKAFGSLLKGYTVGTVFVLVHCATHELRARRLIR
jgi:hypothetical protein